MNKEIIKQVFIQNGLEGQLSDSAYRAGAELIGIGHRQIVQANAEKAAKALYEMQFDMQLSLYNATQRQHIATACLEGLLAGDSEGCWSFEGAAGAAVKYADALIAELNQQGEEGMANDKC